MNEAKIKRDYIPISMNFAEIRTEFRRCVRRSFWCDVKMDQLYFHPKATFIIGRDTLIHAYEIQVDRSAWTPELIRRITRKMIHEYPDDTG